MLLRAWSVSAHRPTRDLDLLGRGEPSRRRLEAVFASLWAASAELDGLELEPGSIRSEEIRDNQEYGGVRVNMVARLGNARIPIQVDVGFGDAVTPGLTEVHYPTLLDDAAPVLLAYPPETVVAEKLQAMVSLGLGNTRMKDFYDLWIIARSFRFAAVPLRNAILATFARRETTIPGEAPVALLPVFFKDPDKQRQWAAFLDRTGLAAPGLPDIADLLRAFLLPLLQAAHDGAALEMQWSASGPWTATG